jgi:hypothetical protein
VIYEPLELMERLAALVHPPRFNITRYFGILAPAASLRPRVIPEAEASSPLRHPAVNPESRLRHRIQEKRRKSVAVNREITRGPHSWSACSKWMFSLVLAVAAA